MVQEDGEGGVFNAGGLSQESTLLSWYSQAEQPHFLLGGCGCRVQPEAMTAIASGCCFTVMGQRVFLVGSNVGRPWLGHMLLVCRSRGNIESQADGRGSLADGSKLTTASDLR